MTAVVAVDFGASSIRVCRVDLAERPPAIDVVHRVPHGPVADGSGRLRWDWDRLVAEMDRGLAAALDPLTAYRAVGYRDAAIAQRGADTVATGL